jgi:hypothetical protein
VSTSTPSWRAHASQIRRRCSASASAYASALKFVEQSCRTLDVGEEERDGAGGEVATHARSVARFGQAAEPATRRLLEELSERLPSGLEKTFDNRVGWAATYLYRVGSRALGLHEGG